MKLSELLKLSRDREVSPDFTAKLMTKLLQQERENTVMQVILGMQVGWVMGMASASQVRISTKTKTVYNYTDYINRGKSQRVVCYDTNASKYIELDQSKTRCQLVETDKAARSM